MRTFCGEVIGVNSLSHPNPGHSFYGPIIIFYDRIIILVAIKDRYFGSN